MRFLCLLILVCAPALWACGPTDRDDSAHEPVLAIISAKLEHHAPEYREATLSLQAPAKIAGVSADSAQLWAFFVEPRSESPPLRSSANSNESTSPTVAPEEPKEESRTRTWITIGVLFVLLTLGALTKARITRSAAKVVNEDDKPEATS